MKILFIGGTGNISMACTKLALDSGFEVFHLNRGTTKAAVPDEVHTLKCDIKDKKQVDSLLKDFTFDVVANFIAFTPEDVNRDFDLFSGKTGQYIFISSASAYQKPLQNPIVREAGHRTRRWHLIVDHHPLHRFCKGICWPAGAPAGHR